MATGQGVAFADATDADGSTGDASTSTSTDTNTEPDGTDPSSAGPDTAPKADAPTSTLAAQTNTSDTPEVVEKQDDSIDTETTSESGAVDDFGTEEADTGEPTTEVDPPTPPVPVEGTEAKAPTTGPLPAPAASGSKTIDGSENQPPGVPPLTVAAPTTAANTSPTPSTTTSAQTQSQSASVTTTNVQDETVSARAMQTYAGAVTTTETLPSSLTAPVTFASIVSDVLRWFGLPPLADNPLPDTPVPPLFEALWMAVRRIEYTFFNDRPTAIPDTRGQDPITGQIEGTLQALDPDGDHLTYTVIDAPDHGTVELNENGGFTYTPGDDIAALGGTDTFTVAISDEVGNPFHLHGPLDALKVFGVDLIGPTTATVSVEVEPVIDAIAIIDIGGTATDVAVSPDGRWLYVTNAAFDTSGRGILNIIDATTNTPYASFRAGRNPTDIAVSADGSRIYIANRDDGTISLINQNQNTDPINIGGTPTALTISPDGTRLYIVNTEGDPSGDGVLQVYDVTTNTLLGTSTTGRNPSDVAFSPDGTRAYITNTGDGTLTVINTTTLRLIHTMNAGRAPTDVAVSPDGARIYVSNTDGTVVVLPGQVN